MTQDNSSQDKAAGQNGGGDLFNTAAGWVLFAGSYWLALQGLLLGVLPGLVPVRQLAAAPVHAPGADPMGDSRDVLPGLPPPKTV